MNANHSSHRRMCKPIFPPSKKSFYNFNIAQRNSIARPDSFRKGSTHRCIPAVICLHFPRVETYYHRKDYQRGRIHCPCSHQCLLLRIRPQRRIIIIFPEKRSLMLISKFRNYRPMPLFNLSLPGSKQFWIFFPSHRTFTLI